MSLRLFSLVALLLVGLTPSARGTGVAPKVRLPTCDIQNDQGEWMATIQAAVYTTEPQMMVVDGRPYTATPDSEGIVTWHVPAKWPLFGVGGTPVTCTVGHEAIPPVIPPPAPTEKTEYRLHRFELQMEPVQVVFTPENERAEFGMTHAEMEKAKRIMSHAVPDLPGTSYQREAPPPSPPDPLYRVFYLPDNPATDIGAGP